MSCSDAAGKFQRGGFPTLFAPATLSGSDLEEGEAVSVASTNSSEPLDHVSDDDWVLGLRDGRHIAIPLSPYRSLESLLHYSVLEGEAVIGTNYFHIDGQITSWADKCDGAVDIAYADMGSECELWESDKGILPFECNGEPLVMVPLATENLAVSESNHMEVFERKP
uniref:Uncharacterized protein n=1 Tax=Quercus lobata TaxID=97700 RepID=A0A7N2L8R8_QUELO